MTKHFRKMPLLAMALASVCASPGGAAPAKGPGVTEAVIGSTRQFDVKSRINGASYRVQIFVPQRAAPSRGHPALYVLDGNALFGSFANAVRNRAMAGEIEPAVVVGISDGEGADRTYDFTASDMTAREKGIIKDLRQPSRFGGAELFLRVLQEEIKPKVAALVNVDESRTALFGWSLGGLFVVSTMLAHPDAFQTYLALSPSLWRGDRAVLKDIPAFETRMTRTPRMIRFFVGVGGGEEKVPDSFEGGDITHEELATEIRYCRMVGNVEALTHGLERYFTNGRLPFASRIFAGDSHNSVPWTALNPVLDFAFPLRPASASPSSAAVRKDQ